MTEKKTFNIIRHYGQPDRLQLPGGEWVFKQDKFFILEYGGFVPVAPYSDHFLYAIPDKLAKKYPGPVYRCSCGSIGIVTGPSGYVWDASPQGKMFVCMNHATYGVHATGGTRWI